MRLYVYLDLRCSCSWIEPKKPSTGRDEELSKSMAHYASSFVESCNEWLSASLLNVTPKCQSVHRILSPSIFGTTPWGCGGWGGGGCGGGLKEMWSPTDYRFSAVLVRGWLLQVNVLGKPRWESIYRNPCFFLSKTSCSEKGNGLGVLDVWEQLMGDTSQLTTTQKTENSKELLTASSSTQLPRVSDISGCWLVNTNKSGSNHWACMKEVLYYYNSFFCHSFVIQWFGLSFLMPTSSCSAKIVLRYECVTE